MKNILLHVCCGPCSLMSFEMLREEGFVPTAYFFNPNIHTQKEYMLRLRAMEKACVHEGVQYIIEGNKDYFNAISGFNSCENIKRYQDALNTCVPHLQNLKDTEIFQKEVQKVLAKWGKYSAEFYEEIEINCQKNRVSPTMPPPSSSVTSNVVPSPVSSVTSAVFSPPSPSLISLGAKEDIFTINSLLWIAHLNNYEEGERCKLCYEERLYATARVAVRHGFTTISSSLLYSRYQNHEHICEAGIKAVEQVNQEIEQGLLGIKAQKIEFIARDFSVRWDKGIEKAKELNLYKQKWCGCLLSRMESLERMAMRPYLKRI